MTAITKGKRAQPKAAKRVAVMRAGQRAPDEAPVLLSDRQRRLLFMLTGAGIAMTLAALVVPPRGATFWLAVIIAPLVVGGIGYVFAGATARSMDAWLLSGGTARPAWQPPPPAALPEAARTALQTAMVPALLAELADRTKEMKPPQRSAAERLVEAGRLRWAAMPPGAGRAAVARDLPALIAALNADSDAAVAEAGRLAALLADSQPVPGAVATPGGRA